MQKIKKNKWKINLFDVLMTLIPSVFILAISTVYFIQLNMHLNILIFLISPIFITYFVVRNARFATQYKWTDWLSIIQYSILFLIGFYTVLEYFQQKKLNPTVNAAVILCLTALILTFVLCIVLYCLLYKYERIVLSKRLYEKQIRVSHDIYRVCYQLLREIKNFMTFSYKLTSLPPQEKSARERLKKKYAQMLSVQKNILAKKQSEVDIYKFYLSKSLQEKLDQLFTMYHQLVTECPTAPEEIRRYELEIHRLHHDFEMSLHRELGVDFLYKEIQLAIKLNKKGSHR